MTAGDGSANTGVNGGRVGAGAASTPDADEEPAEAAGAAEGADAEAGADAAIVVARQSANCLASFPETSAIIPRPN